MRPRKGSKKKHSKSHTLMLETKLVPILTLTTASSMKEQEIHSMKTSPRKSLHRQQSTMLSDGAMEETGRGREDRWENEDGDEDDSRFKAGSSSSHSNKDIRANSRKHDVAKSHRWNDLKAGTSKERQRLRKNGGRSNGRRTLSRLQ